MEGSYLSSCDRGMSFPGMVRYSCSGSGNACLNISGLPSLSINGVSVSGTSGFYNAGTWTGGISSARSKLP